MYCWVANMRHTDLQSIQNYLMGNAVYPLPRWQMFMPNGQENGNHMLLLFICSMYKNSSLRCLVSYEHIVKNIQGCGSADKLTDHCNSSCYIPDHIHAITQTWIYRFMYVFILYIIFYSVHIHQAWHRYYAKVLWDQQPLTLHLISLRYFLRLHISTFNT